MAMNINRGSMNTTTHLGTQIRQMDPEMYRRMAKDKKASFVTLLRLIGMKRSAGGGSNWAVGAKAANCKSYKFEWEDIFPGSPLSSIDSVATDTESSITADNATQINVATGNGSMFQKNDLILDRDTSEQMLVTAVSGDTLTVIRGWGTTTQGTSGTTIAAGNTLVLLANAWNEGSFSPEGRSYNPTVAWNYTQIFKRAVENTGTNEVVLHYGNINKLDFQREEEWYQYLVERSRAYFKGKRVEFTDTADGNKKKRTTAGLDSFITTNIFGRKAFTFDKFIDFCEMAYGYGGSKKLLVCNPALYSLVTKYVLNREGCHYEISADMKKFGLNIQTLTTPFGDMDLLMDLTMKDLYPVPTGFALELDLIEEMVLRPDIWKENVQANDWDGRKDMVIGEAGLKVISEQRHAKIIIDPTNSDFSA